MLSLALGSFLESIRVTRGRGGSSEAGAHPGLAPFPVRRPVADEVADYPVVSGPGTSTREPSWRSSQKRAPGMHLAMQVRTGGKELAR